MVTLSNIRLLATDIDGTLLNPQFQISEGDLTALRRAHAAGIEIVLVTGRRHTFALPIAKQLGFDLWLISSNGAVTRSLSGETFHRDMMPAETCRKLCGAMQEFRGNTVLTFDQETKGAIVLERMDELGREHPALAREEHGVHRVRGSDREGAGYGSGAGHVLRNHGADELRPCGPWNRREWTGMVTVLRTEYPERDLSMIDVLNAGCSKGHALERWAAYRGYRREEVMAVGDNHNDVEMLEFAGHPVIMGNACEELRARGWRVTRGNHECGVAAAVELALGQTVVGR